MAPIKRYPLAMSHSVTPEQAVKRKIRRLTWACFAVWGGVTLVPIYGAQRLNFTLWGWPFNFWMAAQGCVLVYLALVTCFAWQVNRWEAQLPAALESPPG